MRMRYSKPAVAITSFRNNDEINNITTLSSITQNSTTSSAQRTNGMTVIDVSKLKS